MKKMCKNCKHLESPHGGIQKPSPAKLPADERFDGSHAIFECDEWINHGFTIADAVKAKNAYENWSGEKIGYENVDYAITGRNKRSGLLGERLTSFFAGYRLAILMKDHFQTKDYADTRHE